MFLRFEVKISMLFWVVTPCRLIGRYNISEKHTVSIFSPEDGESITTIYYLEFIHLPIFFNHFILRDGSSLVIR
jgi:hypothetical protein